MYTPKKLIMKNIQFQDGRVSYDLVLNGSKKPLSGEAFDRAFPKGSNMRRILYGIARTTRDEELNVFEAEPFNRLLYQNA